MPYAAQVFPKAAPQKLSGRLFLPPLKGISRRYGEISCEPKDLPVGSDDAAESGAGRLNSV